MYVIKVLKLLYVYVALKLCGIPEIQEIFWEPAEIRGDEKPESVRDFVERAFLKDFFLHLGA